MADSDLQSLRDRLRQTIEASVASLSEEATESDFVSILAGIGAMKQIATQLVEVDRRATTLQRAIGGAGGAAADALSSRLEELTASRAKLVDALKTLTREMGR